MNTTVQIHPDKSFPFQLHAAEYGKFAWLRLNEHSSICISSSEEADRLIAALCDLKRHFQPMPAPVLESAAIADEGVKLG